jgi:hypothetical protein
MPAVFEDKPMSAELPGQPTATAALPVETGPTGYEPPPEEADSDNAEAPITSAASPFYIEALTPSGPVTIDFDTATDMYRAAHTLAVRIALGKSVGFVRRTARGTRYMQALLRVDSFVLPLDGLAPEQLTRLEQQINGH